MPKDSAKTDTCWFCGEPTPECGLQVHVYRATTARRKRRRKPQSEFLVDVITVPRCGQCRSAHLVARSVTAASTLVGGLIGLFAFSTISSRVPHGNRLGAVMGLGMAFVGYSAGDRFGRAVLRARQKPESAKSDYPILAKLQTTGWKIGRRPGTPVAAEAPPVRAEAGRARRRKRSRQDQHGPNRAEKSDEPERRPGASGPGNR